MSQRRGNALHVINGAFLLEGLSDLGLNLAFEFLAIIKDVAVEPFASGNRAELRQILVRGQTETVGPGRRC